MLYDDRIGATIASTPCHITLRHAASMGGSGKSPSIWTRTETSESSRMIPTALTPLSSAPGRAMQRRGSPAARAGSQSEDRATPAGSRGKPRSPPPSAGEPPMAASPTRQRRATISRFNPGTDANAEDESCTRRVGFDWGVRTSQGRGAAPLSSPRAPLVRAAAHSIAARTTCASASAPMLPSRASLR